MKKRKKTGKRPALWIVILCIWAGVSGLSAASPAVAPSPPPYSKAEAGRIVAVYGYFDTAPPIIASAVGASVVDTAYPLGASGETAIEAAGAGGVGLKRSVSAFDLSEMEYLHLDVWLAGSATLQVALAWGDDPWDQTPFTAVDGLAPNAWQPIDMLISDIGNLPADKKITKVLVEHTAGTAYLSHVYFYIPAPALPETSAPAPDVAPEKVLSVYSGAYASGVPDGYPQYSIHPQPIVLEGGEVLGFTVESTLGIRLPSADVSGMAFLHMDMWTQDLGTWDIALMSLGGQALVARQTEASVWTGIDIRLDGLNGIDLTALTEISLTNSTGKTVECFIDNIYFYEVEVFTGEQVNRLLNRGMNLSLFEYAEGWASPDYGAGQTNSALMGLAFPFQQVDLTMTKELALSYIDKIAELGFDHIRLPVCWEFANRSLNTAPYTIDADFMQLIGEFVAHANGQGLAVVLNMHHHKDVMRWPQSEQERYVAQWRQIAVHFKAVPSTRLVFELLNEPYASPGEAYMTPELWNDYLLAGMEAVRSVDPTRTVMIGTAEMGGMSGLSALALPDDHNIIVSVHYYTPSDFTHQGASWAGWTGEDLLRRVDWQNNEIDRDRLAADFLRLEDFSRVHGRVPLHMGEFGAFGNQEVNPIDEVFPQARRLWTASVARMAEAAGYSWAYWEYYDNFGVYIPSRQAFRENLLAALLSDNLPEPVAMASTVVYEHAFDRTSDGWSGYGMQAEVADERLNITIVTHGVSWESQISKQLASLPFTLEQGVGYRLSYTMSADRDVASAAIGVVLGQDGTSGYDSYFHASLIPTTEERRYAYAFVMDRADDTRVRLSLDMGLLPAGTVVRIKDVKLERLKHVVRSADQHERLMETTSVTLQAEQHEGVSSYTWTYAAYEGDDFTELPDAGSESYYHMADLSIGESGVYRATAEDKTHAYVQDFYLEVYPKPITTGRDELTDTPLRVYTTADGIRVVSTHGSPIQSVELRDLQGRLLYSEEHLNTSQWIYPHPLPQGVYVLKVHPVAETLKVVVR